MKFTSLLTTIGLAGCMSAPALPPQRVEVPVSVPCVGASQVPTRPAYETPKLPIDATDGNKVLAIARDWVRSRGYEGKLEAIVEECR